MSRKKTTVTGVHPADENHQVLTLATEPGDRATFRKKPCPECPWRKDVARFSFPAEAYRHSARTAYDMSQSSFSCHVSGARRPATCAGFLLRGADHNLSVRMAMLDGRYNPSEVSDDGLDLYDGYRSMAIANGVDPADPAIAPCRGADELEHDVRPRPLHAWEPGYKGE